ncbi:MAG: SMC-Scp complex subunit ScpB, partial [Firmicutes bacterium]|nr:SMC-Scp complex subunit ScpB [Bacillota bacterium]
MTLEESYRIIEGLIFAAPYPLTAKEIGEITGLEPEMVERLIHRIKEKYCDGGIVLRKVAG